MINVQVTKDKNDFVIGFTVKNHGESYVCAAVSILTINTINCIENFTEEPMELHVDEDGAYISCFFPNAKKGFMCHDTELLLKAMLFGLRNIELEHPQHVHIKEVFE